MAEGALLWIRQEHELAVHHEGHVHNAVPGHHAVPVRESHVHLDYVHEPAEDAHDHFAVLQQLRRIRLQNLSGLPQIMTILNG